MHVRVVRFEDVDGDRLEEMMSRIDQYDGPPEGVKSTGLKILHDADQRTAVVLQLFENAQDMSDAEAVFDGMDASETPGRRASVDRCEEKRDLKP